MTTYTEDFDTLSNTAGSTTNTTLPTRWAISETGGGARDNEQYAVDTGGSNTGDTYSYGAAGSTDRAVGGLQSGTLIPVIGASFTNEEGATITELAIAYTGEQWRLGTAGRADRLDFQISFDATSLTTGTWIDVDALDFSSPFTTTAGARDGNAAVNQTAISHTITGVDIAAGTTFWIRWTDFNASGADDGLAIDDFSLTTVTGGGDPVLGTLGIADASVGEGDSGAQDIAFTVNRTGGSDGAVSATWTVTLPGGTDGADAGDFATATLTGTVAFADGQTSATILIPVQGDADVEPDEVFTVTLSDPTGGAALGDATATGTILNDDAAPAPGVLSIADANVAEGDSGTQDIVFTVTRADGSAGAVEASWTVTFPGGTDGANSGDFAGGTSFTGTVAFADGQTSATIALPVEGDADVEPDELFTVTLSAPTGGATLGDATATGTIGDDDAPPPNVFINEIHYDDDGTDIGEAIEIAGVAGADLTGWSLVLYTGSNGTTYNTRALSGVIADQQNGFGTIAFAYPVNGIQNGNTDGTEPDGIALVDPDGNVVQFLSYEGGFTATNGPAAGMTSTDIGVAEQPAPADGFSLQLTGGGSSYADFTWAPAGDDNFGAVNTGQTFYSPTGTAHYRIDDASVAEGDAGTVNLLLTVHRAGGTDLAGSVDYAVTLDGTADSADLDPAAVLSGTIEFAEGESIKQVVIAVQGDTTGEPNETLHVTLSNATGDAVIDDATATGTIVNDDPVTLEIGTIQGLGHQSEYVGQLVSAAGIVTAVDSNGFWLQSEGAGDGNAATSDGIFVFTSSAPTVAVGDSLVVDGTVAEFQGGAAGLSVTQIAAPTIAFVRAGNDLPDAIVIGMTGLLPPSGTIDDDGLASYDPAADGIDFWESLEGMRVTIDAPLVVSNTNNFGETDVVASGGAGATGVNDRGGITISAGDYNPEKIQIDDDSAVFGGYTPGHSIGDTLASVTGVVNYAFDMYEVIVTEAVTVANDATLGDETTALTGDASHLTIATYNVENLDPGDGAAKFDMLADDIVYSLGAPDIIALQEVQDADGAGSGSDLSGYVTAQALIDAIYLESGLTYTYVEVTPTTANSSGGEPNGNIRNGYLYLDSRVDYVAGSAELITGTAYDGSRKPLVASWMFNGEQVTTINVHFTSRLGSDPLWGDAQPPADAGDASRTDQAAGVLAWVNDHLADDPDMNIAVLGDWNGFYFEEAQTQLTDSGVLSHLATLLPEEERYSYLFEGNSQLIDNILVTSELYGVAELDAVHLNAEFTGTRPTDHDPQVARFFIPVPNQAPALADPTSATLVKAFNGSPIALMQGVTVSDADADLSLAGFTLEVSGAGGAILLAGGTSFELGGAGAIVDSGSGNTVAIVSGLGTDAIAVSFTGDATGALADALLQAFTWQPTGSAAPGTRTVTLTFDDGGSGIGTPETDTATQSLDVPFNTIAGANDPVAGDTLVGTAAGDLVLGLDGPDSLDGGAGADRLEGGAGDDSYVIDDAGDRAIENGGEGSDSVESSVSYSVAGQHIEDLTLVGAAAINGTGNSLDNAITGSSANNLLRGAGGDDMLDGGLGADTLLGGTGDDTFVVDDAGDVAVELDGEGSDTVVAALSWTLAGQYIETLILVGAAAIGTGNSLDNTLSGVNAGANLLFGRSGDDTYQVGAGDLAVERDGEGIDTVISEVGYSLLGQYVENLTLVAGAAIGTGNGLDNAITGNAAANTLDGRDGDDTLDGGAGADVLRGGTGDDTYHVDNLGDRVIELNETGIDTVRATVSFNLNGTYVENLVLVGTGTIGAWGNSLDNQLDGLSLAAGGANILVGGAGDDSYSVGAGDSVVEKDGEGTDTVYAAVSFSLVGQYVENLVLIAEAAIDGTGNGLANILLGNAGDDTLVGGAGHDQLQGGAGADRFVLDRFSHDEYDVIVDFAPGTDRIVLDAAVFGLAPGALSADDFVVGGEAQDADDHIIYNATIGVLLYDADGAGGAAAYQIATFNTLPTLGVSDFLVI